MRLTRDGKFERSDIWREGKWLDLWSVVHFFSGLSMAFSITLLDFGFWESSIIVFLLLVAYELWEAMVKIEETPQNRFMDVVVGMVSFVPAFLFLRDVSGSYFILAFGLTLTVNGVLATFGWIASQKALTFERKLRSEFVERQQRLRERRAQFRATMGRAMRNPEV